MATTARILVCGPDRSMRRAVRAALTGFSVVETTDELTTTALAVACRAQAIVLDATGPHEPGRTAVALRRDFRTAFTPLLFIVGEAPADEAIGASFGGADDYLVRPIDADELAARVRLTLRRSVASRAINPVTGLPGNAAVRDEIAARLAGGSRFACLHIDLDDFKAFNDRFGFARGDDVIRAAGRCVVQALERQLPAECFAGHVGGDDLVVLIPPEQCEAIAAEIIRCFDGASTGCSMSIGIVPAAEGFTGLLEIAEAAAAAKGVAKRGRRSSWALHRGGS